MFEFQFKEPDRIRFNQCFIISGVNRSQHSAMPYYLYIFESLKDSSNYVGSANDLEDRLKRHNQGRVSYTKSKRPWKLVYYEDHPDRSSAMKREYAIKRRKSKHYIESLINSYQNKA